MIRKGLKSIEDLFFRVNFHTRNLLKLGCFLGIKVAQSKEGSSLSQWTCALDILEKMGLLRLKPVETHKDPSVIVFVDRGALLPNRDRHHRLIGKLNYYTITCPYISSNVSVVRQYILCTHLPHWEEAFWLVRYLKAHTELLTT